MKIKPSSLLSKKKDFYSYSATEFGAKFFDEIFYKSMYKDVQGSALNHWLTFGLKEGRSPHPLVDLLFYRSNNPDIPVGNELDHYLTHGWIEGRQISPLLSELFYRRSNGIERYIGISILEDACNQLANSLDLDTGLIDTKNLGSPFGGTPLDRLRGFVLKWGSNIRSLDSVRTISITDSDSEEDLRSFQNDPNDWLTNATLVLPIHKDHPITRQLITRISAICRGRVGTDVQVVADGCSEHEFLNWLIQEIPPEINLTINANPKGFSGAIDCAIEASSNNRNIIVVNADVLVHPQVFTLLCQALEENASLASVSAISNYGSLASYPIPGVEAHWLPVSPDELSRAAEEIFHYGSLVPTPFAMGHLFIVRRSAWNQVGGFDSVLFPDGYGEETKWSLDSSSCGWSHAIAPGAFAWHVGSTSFANRKESLKQRAEKILQGLGPKYQEGLNSIPETKRQLISCYAKIEAHLASKQHPVNRIIITHDRGGGTYEHINRNLKPSENDLIIFLESQSESFVADGPSGFWPNLLGNSLPLEILADIALLINPRNVEFHTGTSPNAEVLITQMIAIARALPTRVVLHDFGPFCARISLMGGNSLVPKFCGGITSDTDCQDCATKHGSDIGPVRVGTVRSLGRILFDVADEVEVPGVEAQQIWAKWGVQTTVLKHKEDYDSDESSLQAALERAKTKSATALMEYSRRYSASETKFRVLIPGRISEGKGARLVSQVVALNRLYGSPFSFVLCGEIDQRFQIVSNGFDLVLSNYSRALPKDLKNLAIDATWIPCVAPETHMYTLDDLFFEFQDVPIFLHENSGAALRRSKEMWKKHLVIVPTSPGAIISEMFHLLSHKKLLN